MPDHAGYPRIPIIKRVIDLTIGIPLVILLSPLYLVIAILVALNLGTPVLFRQKRPGFRAKPFFIYKFRTMTDERGPDGQYLPDSHRLTPLGKFLRSTSLDELPEFLNVIQGDLSLVGPRPLLMKYLPLYNPEQARRHDVMPGITGWAQVNGRNTLSWEEKFQLDVWYVDHWSVGLDLKILGMTAGKVLKREGISQNGQATAEEFKGSVHPPDQPGA